MIWRKSKTYVSVIQNFSNNSVQQAFSVALDVFYKSFPSGSIFICSFYCHGYIKTLSFYVNFISFFKVAWVCNFQPIIGIQFFPNLNNSIKLLIRWIQKQNKLNKLIPFHSSLHQQQTRRPRTNFGTSILASNSEAQRYAAGLTCSEGQSDSKGLPFGGRVCRLVVSCHILEWDINLHGRNDRRSRFIVFVDKSC